MCLRVAVRSPAARRPLPSSVPLRGLGSGISSSVRRVLPPSHLALAGCSCVDMPPLAAAEMACRSPPHGARRLTSAVFAFPSRIISESTRPVPGPCVMPQQLRPPPT